MRIASVLSLLLCILFLALRIRAGLTHDYISWARNGTYVAARSGGDALDFHEYGRWPIDESLNWQHGTSLLGPTLIDLGAPRPLYVPVDPGFHPISTQIPLSPGEPAFLWRLKRVRGVLALSYTHWIFYLSVLPLLELGFWIRRRVQAGIRRNAGCCPACGYNLTGNISAVCPECGATCEAPGPAAAGVRPEEVED